MLLWPKSSSSQVGPQNYNVLICQGGAGWCILLSLCLLPGRRVGGQTALQMGLVNRAVDQNQAGDAAYREALSLAREILPQVRSSSSLLLILLIPQASDLLPSFLLCYVSSLTSLFRPCRSVFLLLHFGCLQCLTGCHTKKLICRLRGFTSTF